MKKLIHLLYVLLIGLGSTFLISCSEEEMDESLPLNPVLNPFKAVTAQDGNQIVYATISNENRTIHFEFAKLKAEQRKAVPVNLHISKRAKLISHNDTIVTLDLTKPCEITVNNLYKDITYTITASAPFRLELWRKNAAELNFVRHNNAALAFSGEYLVVHERTKFDYYKIADGTKAGTLSFEGIDWATLTRTVPLFMAGDDAGNIVATNFYRSVGIPVGGNNIIHMYWWEGVTAKPKLLFAYDVDLNDLPGDKDVGRRIYVKGNIKEHALLYMGVSNQNMFLRWEIKKGQVVSGQPEKVAYDPGYQMGMQPTVVPIEFGKESNYFISRYDAGAAKVAITYMDGKTNKPKYKSEHHIQDIYHQGLGGGYAFDYLDLGAEKYIFVIEQNNNYWMREIYNVTGVINNPSGTSTNPLDYVVAGTRVWNAWLDSPMDPVLGVNGNVTGDVVIKVSPDKKTAIVAFLCTNSGVVVWEINARE
jgi:hypothetical protein